MTLEERIDRLEREISKIKYDRIDQDQITPNAVKQEHIDGLIIHTGLSTEIPDGTTHVKAWFSTDTNQLCIYNGGWKCLTIGLTGYTVSNLTTDRAYDADSTATAELADVLGTLISDLGGS